MLQILKPCKKSIEIDIENNKCTGVGCFKVLQNFLFLSVLLLQVFGIKKVISIYSKLLVYNLYYSIGSVLKSYFTCSIFAVNYYVTWGVLGFMVLNICFVFDNR